MEEQEKPDTENPESPEPEAKKKAITEQQQKPLK